jgi:hypothetical protein
MKELWWWCMMVGASLTVGGVLANRYHSARMVRLHRRVGERVERGEGIRDELDELDDWRMRVAEWLILLEPVGGGLLLLGAFLLLVT